MINKYKAQKKSPIMKNMIQIELLTTSNYDMIHNNSKTSYHI